MDKESFTFLAIVLILIFGTFNPVFGQVISNQKIDNSDIVDITGLLDPGDSFGRSVADIGDLNSDGIPDIAVGAPFDINGGEKRGAVWILFLNSDGTVKSHQKISDTEGNFTGVLPINTGFGQSISSIGDLNNDGKIDIVVGATGDDDGGSDRGAVWVLFLNSDGTVKSHQKISDTDGGFTGTLDDNDVFGSSVTNTGDIDGDGNEDIAVGTGNDDDGGTNRGAVWILFLNSDGTVKSHQKISDTDGGFTGTLLDSDFFGRGISGLGTLDGDNIPDLAVGAECDDDGGSACNGAVWILFLNSNGTVKSHQKISAIEGNFTGVLPSSTLFGTSVSSIGDLNSDGLGDIVVGANGDDDGGINKGAVWVLFLNSNGTVKSHQKISSTQGGFGGDVEGGQTQTQSGDRFGASVSVIGDLDNDGKVEIIVGADSDRDDETTLSGMGSAWVLFLNSNGTVITEEKISDNSVQGIGGILTPLSKFGNSITSVGDLDNDGIKDIVVGASGHYQNGSSIGAAYVLFMNSDESVKSHQRITNDEGGINFVPGSNFGVSVLSIDDFDSDGNNDLFVGASTSNEGNDINGRVWQLNLNSDGTVKESQFFTSSGLTNSTIFSFGRSLTGLGDIDGDGNEDIAVAGVDDDSGGGVIWILFLNSDGTIKSHQEISDNEGFPVVIADLDDFGISLAGLGDLDGDGNEDIAVGTDNSIVFILFLNSNGTVKSLQEISETEGGFTGVLDSSTFGNAVANGGDIDGDGIVDLIVGESLSDDGGQIKGAIWILFLNSDGTVKSHQKISEIAGGFTGILKQANGFGGAVANLDDYNNDTKLDIAVGAIFDNEEGNFRGAIWILSLRGMCEVPNSGVWIITESCEISSDIIAPASVRIENNAVVTVNSDGSLTILSGENIIIVKDSGLELKQGSTLQVNS